MAKKAKRKTLPADFSEIVQRGNADEILSVFDTCDINAYSRTEYGKPTALMYPEMPPALIRKLVELGADINHVGDYHRTPLLEHAYYMPENIPLLLELGADLNGCPEGFGAETALHYCAGGGRAESVRTLLALGADPDICCGYFHNNALENLAQSAGLGKLCGAAETAELLIQHGMEITDTMREKIRALGAQFVFYRRTPNPDDPEEAAMQKLYALFGVEPAARLQVHDSKSPIVLKGDTWQQQYDNLWKALVPPSGHAETVQGEVIRLIGRLAHEILDNGGCNWDADFREMRDFLAEILSGLDSADESVIKAVRNISPNTGENAFEMIAKAVVEWILSNPDPVALGNVTYNR